MKRARLLFGRTLLLIASLVLSPAVHAQETGTWNGQTVEYWPGQIAVKLAPGATPAEVDPLLEEYGADYIFKFDELGWALVRLAEGRDIFPVIDVLKRSPHVAVAEPNLVMRRLSNEPDDPYFQGTSPATYNHQWGLKNTGQDPPNGLDDADIDAELAWSLTTGSTDVVIAVLDTGIPMEDSNGDGTWDESDLSHPDLDDSNKIILGSDYAPDSTGDPVGDGKGVKDENGHGTHVAGISGAETNNGKGDCRGLLELPAPHYSSEWEKWLVGRGLLQGSQRGGRL